MRWRWVAVAAVAAVVLQLAAGVLAAVIRSPSAAALLSLASYFAAGLLVAWFAPVVLFAEPAIGAAIAALGVGVAQLVRAREALPNVPRGVIVFSVLVAMLISASAALLGTYAGRRLRGRRPERAQPA